MNFLKLFFQYTIFWPLHQSFLLKRPQWNDFGQDELQAITVANRKQATRSYFYCWCKSSRICTNNARLWSRIAVGANIVVSLSRRHIFERLNVTLFISVLYSDEAMRLTAQPNNVKGKQTLKFVEQCYLLSGIVLVFQTQVTFLFGKFWFILTQTCKKS